jgi:hypothetical protein
MYIKESIDMKKREIKQNNAYDYHDTFDDHGIAVVGKNGKFGYIRQNGEEITPCKYDKAMRFYWDVGKVCINGKWGLVDISGKEITPLVYDEIKGPEDPIVKLNGKYGYINRKTGELLTPIKYDHADRWTQNLKLRDDNSDNKDLAQVQLDEKWGCINIHGKEVVPLKYDKIVIHQGEDPCVAVCFDGKWGFTDSAGTEIAPCEYDGINPFREHRACVKKNGKYGFIDDKGALVIPVIYDDCEPHFDKYYDDEYIYPIVMMLNGKYGYIDINGNETVKPIYENANSFGYGKGMAAVTLYGKVGFIDEAGKTIIPFIYDPDDDPHDNDFNRYRFFDNFANVKFNGKWGVIDRKNNIVIAFVYDEFLKNQHAGWRYAIRNGRKLGIDTKGNEWPMQKNPDAQTFKDYLHAVALPEVIKKGRKLLDLSKKDVENLKISFDNFISKSPRSSQNIIRIHADYGWRDWKHPPVDAALYCVNDECSYVYFDWEEILDMEVRIEDNLTLSDAEIVAICIWEACDQILVTEENIQHYLDKIYEKAKTNEENLV